MRTKTIFMLVAMCFSINGFSKSFISKKCDFEIPEGDYTAAFRGTSANFSISYDSKLIKDFETGERFNIPFPYTFSSSDPEMSLVSTGYTKGALVQLLHLDGVPFDEHCFLVWFNPDSRDTEMNMVFNFNATEGTFFLGPERPGRPEEVLAEVKKRK